MTRKDYKLIASNLAVILQASGNKDSIMLRTAVHGLMQDLKEDNPRFDQEKFMEAVGLN